MIAVAWSDYWGLELQRSTLLAGRNGVFGPIVFGIYLRRETQTLKAIENGEIPAADADDKSNRNW